MAHQVERMFSVRKKPWHYGETGQDGRTQILDTYPDNWEEARVLSGLDWDPIEEVPYRQEPYINEKTGQPDVRYAPVPQFKWIARSDTGAILAPAPDTYKLITNSDMGDIIETMLDGYDVQYETGGCLDEGRAVWALLRVGDYLEIPGDPSPTARYIALLNNHDGHGACKAIATNIRIVCANTWTYADTEAAKSSACFSFQHRANWRAYMKEIQDDVRLALSGANKELNLYRELAEDMTSKQVTEEQELRFVDEFIYPTKDEYKLKPKSLENVRRARNSLSMILQSKTCEGVRGTAYGLMQAGGEYLDHVRPHRTRESLLNRTIFETDELKTRARNFAELAHQGML